MVFEWFHWAILGLALMISELLIPAFVLVWFGLGALIVAALVALVDVGLTTQLLTWIVASTAFVLLWFKVFKHHQHATLSGRSSAEVVGEVGLLISDIDPFTKAKVRFQTPLIGSDVWECVADETIKANSRVKVIKVEGSLLRIAQEKKL